MGTFFLNHQEGPNNSNPGYKDLRNNTEVYTADYFYALLVDQQDEYDPKKYYFMEIHDDVASTPHHLFNPDALYRAETAYEGNQLVKQKFFNLPFSMDIHFSYNNLTGEMDYDKVSDALNQAEDKFDKEFEERFVNNKKKDKGLKISEKIDEFIEESGENDWTDEEKAAGKFAISNMLGSMTYL